MHPQSCSVRRSAQLLYHICPYRSQAQIEAGARMEAQDQSTVSLTATRSEIKAGFKLKTSLESTNWHSLASEVYALGQIECNAAHSPSCSSDVTGKVHV